MLRSATPPACSCSKSFSSETPRLACLASDSRRNRSPRCSARSRARRSFSTTRPSSPAGGGSVRVGAEHELEVGDEQDLLEQLVEVLALLRRDLRDLRRPPPLLRLQ